MPSGPKPNAEHVRRPSEIKLVNYLANSKHQISNYMDSRLLKSAIAIEKKITKAAAQSSKLASPHANVYAARAPNVKMHVCTFHTH